MATTVARLEAVLEANTKSFEHGMDKAEGRMHKVGKASAVAGAAIIGGLAVGLEHSIKAAVEAQAAQVRLETAFKTAGISAAKYREKIDQLESSGRKLGFTDEQTKQAFGSLIVATHSVKKATEDLAVAQDIARFKHTDLTSATKILAMAQAGSQRATKQLGLSIQPVTKNYDNLKATMGKTIDAHEKTRLAAAKLIDKQATAAKVIDTVKKKLGGQADAYSKTAAGGMEQFHAQLDHLEVKAGKGLLPALVKVTGKLSDLMNFFSEHTTTAKVFAAAIATVGGALIGVSVATKIATAATKLYTAAQWLLNIAMDANPIGIVILALTALGIGLVIAYKKVKFFRDGVNEAWSWIKEHWPLLLGIIGGPIGLAVVEIIKHWGAIKGAFTSGLDWIKSHVSSIFSDVVGFFRDLPGRLANAFTGGIKAVKNAITGLFGKVIDWAKSALGISSPSSVFHEIGQNVVKGFINGVGSMGGVLKNAVVHLATSALSKLNPFSGGTTLPPHTLHGSGLAGGFLPSGSIYVKERKDEGRDFITNPGGSIIAPGAGTVTGVHSDPNGFGPNYPTVRFSDGPYKSREMYIGHTHSALSAGTHFSKNQRLAITGFGSNVGNATVPGWAEIGFWPPSWSNPAPFDKGGWLPTGVSLAVNNTGKPERVLGPGEGGENHFHFYAPVGSERDLMGWVQQAADQWQRSNGGRSAF